MALADWDARVEFLVKMSPEGIHSKRFQKLSLHAAFNRILNVFKYKSLPDKCISSKITLIRPSEVSMVSEDDYGLSKVRTICHLFFYSFWKRNVPSYKYYVLFCLTYLYNLQDLLTLVGVAHITLGRSMGVVGEASHVAEFIKQSLFFTTLS